jgi:peptidyl-prolyl cis-trans isomerase SurA
MKGQGLSRQEYRQFLKSKIERQAIIETEIISKLRISDEDALAEYIRTHPDRKSTVQEFTVAHIFFNPKKNSVEKSVEKAELVLGKLNAGEKFEDLAEQFSEDPNFTTGGLLGSFKSGEVSPEIEKAIQGLSPGQTTKIVKTKLGVHIVKLLDRKVTSDPRFEKERERIKAGLLEAAFKKQLKRWLLLKRDEAFIKINEVAP